MKATEIDARNVSEALAEVEQFMQRNPIFDGSELSANVLWEKMAQEGRAFNVDELERTWHELASKGLLDDGVDYSIDAFLEPVQGEREYKPEDEDDPNVEVVEYTWHDGPQPTREQYEGLSTKELRALIEKHDQESAPPKSIDEELAGLTTAQLGQLIVRAGKR